MAFRDGLDDEALRDAWGQFCDRLKAAGDLVFKDYNPPTPLHRADGFRFLTQNLGQAFDLALETRDPRFPALHAFCNPTRKLGGDAADFVYLQAWIDGDSVYRITGDRGTCRFLNVTVQGPRPDKQPGTEWPSLHDPFGDIPEANLFAHQIRTEWDGGFELYIGGPERGPNWLPTTPGSRKLFIRQGFDRWEERPAKLRIERVDMSEPRPALTPADLIAGMDWAGEFVGGLMRDWPDHPYHYTPARYLEHLNAFPPDPSAGDGGNQKRGRAAVNMTWSLAQDEALIVSFDRHEGFWMASMMGAFFSSLDYLYRPVSYTPSRARADADGKVRLILAHDDPGYHNWLDTQGLVLGNLTYRNLMSAQGTELSTQLVKRSELEDALPSGAARITPEERAAQLHERFNAIRRRYAF